MEFSIVEYGTYHAGNCDVIELHSGFNANTVDDVRDSFDYLLKGCFGDVLVDMRLVDDLDSSGIGALVFLYKRLKSDKRELGLLGVNGRPDELLTMLGIN